MSVMSMKHIWVVPAFLAALLAPRLASAQDPTPAVNPPVSTQRVEPCVEGEKQPPANSPPLLKCIEFVYEPDGNSSLEQGSYLYYMQRRMGSVSTTDSWVPYDEDEILGDWQRIWNTGFVDDLWIERIDEPYRNGTPGVHIVYHIEEKQRLKVVDYTGSKQVEISKIEEAYKAAGITIRYDTFVDESVIKKVRQIIKELYAEKGYNDATVEVEKAAMAGGPKLLRLTFDINEGPKFRITDLQFDGNVEVSDAKLRKQMKANRPRNWLSWITSTGDFHETKLEEDTQRVADFYQNEGYVKARVGSAQIERLGVSDDGKTRFVRLRVPVDEGKRHRVGTVEVAGNTTIRSEYLRALFQMKTGEFYVRRRFVKGYEQAREVYGSFGYMDMTMVPELSFPGDDPATGKPIGPEPVDPVDPVVDIKLDITEGTRFYVNRIAFAGNVTTHDTVVRRDMRVLEGDVFNAAGLKESVRRINQLGYFKPIEQNNQTVVVEKTPGVDDKVDITLKVEEQNRNTFQFGAGISQFEGFFGQASYQSNNFLGRGETIGVSLQKGVQASNFQVSFNEPYLFDRPISAGIDVFKRSYIFPLAYTQESTGSNTVVGFPLRSYTRGFMSYSYEQVLVKDVNPALTNASVQQASPYLADSLLTNNNGRRTVSKLSPSIVYNTVNQPVFPTAGARYSLTTSLAGSVMGGNTDYWSTSLEAIKYFTLSSRTSLGLRGQTQYIRPYGRTETLPIFEKYFMGGEYSVRGFDIRSIGPRDFNSGIVTGGNKTLLFNAEFSVNVGGPVRLIGFYDAGQVQDIGQRLKFWEPVNQINVSPLVLPYLANANPLLAAIGYVDVIPLNFTSPKVTTVQVGKTSAFRTSTGLEVRFFMPVLNIPFRLIAAYNPQRYGVLDNTLSPQPKFNFRFAVGQTF
jgi:outer membrane protein insertion porin family